MSKKTGKQVWDPKIWHYRQETSTSWKAVQPWDPVMDAKTMPRAQVWVWSAQTPTAPLHQRTKHLLVVFWGRTSLCRRAGFKIPLLCFIYSLTYRNQTNHRFLCCPLSLSPHSLRKGLLLNLKLASYPPLKTRLAAQQAPEILSLPQSSQHGVTDTCGHSWLFMWVLGP